MKRLLNSKPLIAESLFVFALLILTSKASLQGGEIKSIAFSRDKIQQVRNILSDKCFSCHGPDEKKRKGKLRLDSKVDAYATRDSGVPISPGKPDESLIYTRVTSLENEEVMPPSNTGKSLNPQEKEVLKEWISAGAPWADHWAFIAPVKPEVPGVKDSNQIRNPIDSFIQSRLESENLTSNEPANRMTLIRRLYLDLTGLPPSPQELDSILSDNSPDADQKLVRKLLDSPHYGEKWAQMWLDAARYADSDGYEKDKGRQVWAWRDWVVNAFNRDLPYDKFIIEQIAGDLLPDATDSQRIATGFLRNSMINEEGGIDPEQFRMEAMFDRMDAVGKSMLGLTIQCAQCHNHKFDPLTQSEYYGIFAFLNNSHESTTAAYTPDDERKRSEVIRKVREAEDRLREQNPDWQIRMAKWEQEVMGRKALKTTWETLRPSLDASGGQKHYLLEDGSVLAAGYAPTKHSTEFSAETGMNKISAVRLELLNDQDLPLNGPGRSIYGLFALSEFSVLIGPKGKPGEAKKIKIIKATSDANPPEKVLDPAFNDKTTVKRVTGPVQYAIDEKVETAWTTDLGYGRSNVPRQAVFVFEKPVEISEGAIITIKLNQSHGGWNSDDNQNNNLGRFRFSVTSETDVESDPVPGRVREALAIEPSKRSEMQIGTIFSHWRSIPPEFKSINDEIEKAWSEYPQGSSQLILSQRKTMRPTYRLERGDFLKPKEIVNSGVPGFLNPLKSSTGEEPRLQFAKWLADRNAPTTARSIVNRIWQSYFGTGLVATSEDLGSQSESPSHPELLDWLAVDFMDHGWSLKHLHETITSSAAYRRSSKPTSLQLQKDPYNRLLARGPRHRVDAEGVRDIALAASGLLNPAIGGPSVFPPAPEFLFKPPVSYGPKVWREDKGPNRYRRSLYTFRFRSVPYPVLQTFDAPNGDVSCVRRATSNTPMQALVTLNETTFIEAARALGLKTVEEGGRTDIERARFAFRRCLSRPPTPQELAVLIEMKTKTSESVKSDPARALKLSGVTSANISSLKSGTTPSELAGWVAVSRVLLNLDETITKE